MISGDEDWGAILAAISDRCTDHAIIQSSGDKLGQETRICERDHSGKTA